MGIFLNSDRTGAHAATMGTLPSQPRIVPSPRASSVAAMLNSAGPASRQSPLHREPGHLGVLASRKAKSPAQSAAEVRFPLWLGKAFAEGKCLVIRPCLGNGAAGDGCRRRCRKLRIKVSFKAGLSCHSTSMWTLLPRRKGVVHVGPQAASRGSKMALRFRCSVQLFSLSVLLSILPSGNRRADSREHLQLQAHL